VNLSTGIWPIPFSKKPHSQPKLFGEAMSIQVEINPLLPTSSQPFFPDPGSMNWKTLMLGGFTQSCWGMLWVRSGMNLG
jgi:hypothetical protein